MDLLDQNSPPKVNKRRRVPIAVTAFGGFFLVAALTFPLWNRDRTTGEQTEKVISDPTELKVVIQDLAAKACQAARIARQGNLPPDFYYERSLADIAAEKKITSATLRKSLTDYVAAHRNSPDLPPLWKAKADFAVKNFEAAAREATTAARTLAIEPTPPDSTADFFRTQQCQAWNLAGTAWLSASRFRDAFRAFKAWGDLTYSSRDPAAWVDAQIMVARMMEELGRNGEAEALLRRIQTIQEQLHGSESPEVALTLNNLGMVLQHSDRNAEAEKLYRLALQMDERHFGPGHLRVSNDLSNLGVLLRLMNRRAESESLARRALAIVEQNCSPADPDLILSSSDLALAGSDAAEGDMLVERAMSLEAAIYGQHPVPTPKSVLFAAKRTMRRGGMEEAQSRIKEGLALADKCYGKENPACATYYDQAGAILMEAGALRYAEPLLQEALDITRATGGRGTLEEAVSLTNLSCAVFAGGNTKGAEDLLREAVEISERAGDKGAATLSACLRTLGTQFDSSFRSTEAEALFRKSLAVAEKINGTEDPRVVLSLSNLAVCLSKNFKMDEAEQLLRRAVGIQEKNIEGDQRTRTSVLHALARCLVSKGKPAQAEPFMRKAMLILIDASKENPSLAQPIRETWADYLRLLDILQATEVQIKSRLDQINTGKDPGDLPAR